jgi:hypothetical protein
LYDYSLSRSRVVLTGDYVVREIEKSVEYDYYTEKSEKDPLTNTDNGLFYYKSKLGVPIFYFMFRPGKQVVTPLISDPEKSAFFAITEYGWNKKDPIYNLPYLRELSIKHVSKQIGNNFFYCSAPASIIWHKDLPKSISVAKTATVLHKYAVREAEPLTVTKSTGYTGGVEVIKVPEFKKIISAKYNRDDTPLMRRYIDLMTDYYKPTYGGRLVVQGLETHLNLLDKVSITNTNLTSDETTALVIHSIHFDCVRRETTLELSDRVFINQPYFDFQGDLRRKEARLKNRVDTLNQWTIYRK